ncbi:hypothetical protein Phum_PHUM247930 [Pediculus humanus corporis]|uniref:HTH OST-type domain-containing protein n=1 Tax=Pediculus humanus subsp. corporis TaxID=121224 RepID=E0VJL4_PEDHC|nr:uncharacterized protein Phum_PHUM247930 [Pediculus humanus corporis]EEB13570.1 hypothetical protein Phum_PHUM247930 [Pediculus humanus corporis]
MDKEEVVTIIRSIISSSQAPLKISQINNDFKKHTGISIPFFEFKNLVEFFQSIPETVKLTGNPTDYYVGLVISKKSAHIVSLVEKQKKNRKTTKFDSFKYVKPCSLTSRKFENRYVGIIVITKFIR